MSTPLKCRKCASAIVPALLLSACRPDASVRQEQAIPTPPPSIAVAAPAKDQYPKIPLPKVPRSEDYRREVLRIEVLGSDGEPCQIIVSQGSGSEMAVTNRVETTCPKAGGAK